MKQPSFSSIVFEKETYSASRLVNSVSDLFIDFRSGEENIDFDIYRSLTKFTMRFGSREVRRLAFLDIPLTLRDGLSVSRFFKDNDVTSEIFLSL